MAEEAARGLISLAAARSPPRNPRETQIPRQHITPERSNTRQKFVMTGLKRQRQDALTLFYTSGTDTVGVPLFKRDDETTFIQRRRRIIGLMCDTQRKEAYCTWKKTVVSIKISTEWRQVRETFRETRFVYKGIQLVVLRNTCVKGRKDMCINCSTPSRRMKCLSPTLRHYVLPTSSQFTNNSCDANLDTFDPINTNTDVTHWLNNVPPAKIYEICAQSKSMPT